MGEKCLLFIGTDIEQHHGTPPEQDGTSFISRRYGQWRFSKTPRRLLRPKIKSFSEKKGSGRNGLSM
jgi:hypothetical protein